MNERQFLIEVLLRARETISQVAQKAAKSLDDVTAAQKRNEAATASSSEAARRRVTALEQLIEAHTREKKGLEDSSKALRTNATALREQADSARRSLEVLKTRAEIEKKLANEKEKRDIEEVRRLRREVAEREESTAKKTRAYNAETRQLRRQATLLEALGREEAAINKRRAAEADLQIAQSRSTVVEQERSARTMERTLGAQERSISSINKALGSHVKELDKLHARTDTVAAPLGRFGRVMDRLGVSSNNARQGLRGLNAEFQGFKVAIVIKYAQSLISALTALAAQLVAVAAAAGQAAVGIGAALAAGAAQAVPAIGVLVAAFARLTSVLKVVKLQNQQQLTATHDAARAAKAQQNATDQIRSAEERVADAHRNTARAVQDLTRTRIDSAREEVRAQQDVNQARKDAIRTVEDLKAAEEDAAQSLEQARVTRQQAIESGDVAGAVQADIGVARARTGLRRARQDAAPARARGVEGIDAVQQAEQRLADTRRQAARQIESAEDRLGDARRNEVQATDDLSRTRREAADNVAQETAAVDKLADSIAQLSPVERELYRRILALQDVYKRVARPITDILTNAFTSVVDRVNQLLQDPRIIVGFRNIATQIAASIRSATSEAGGGASVGAFQILSAEAARNIPIATRILLNFFRAVRNLVIDAVPAFRLLLGYVEDYSERAEDASRNSEGIRDFFITGVRYAKSFFDLALAVIELLLAIAGPGGAAKEGNDAIKDLTDSINDLTDRVRDNAGDVRRFFARARDATDAVLSVVVTLGETIIESFSPESVQSFADFLNRVIIPALGNTIQIMGALVTLFHQVFSLPGIAPAAEFLVTVLLLAKGLTVIRVAMASIATIIPNFLRAMGLMRGLAIGSVGFWAVAILAVVAAIVLLDRKFHFLAPTFKFLKRVAADVWDSIKSGAEALASWFSDVWTQGLLYWLRWPFVKAFEFLRDQGVFSWIINAAKDVVSFFMGDTGGAWGSIRDLLVLPFRVALAPIRVAFRLVRDIVQLALDLIAGRFDDFGDHIKDFWSDFVDIGKGAISSLLDIIGDLLGALGEIPKIGGPFKAAAAAIREAQTSIDESRDANKKAREERKKSDEAIKDSIPNIVRLKNRYDDATEAVKKAKPGTDAYRRAVDKAKDAHHDYNTALHNTADKSNAARQPVGRLRRNIEHLGDASSDTASAVASDLNAVLESVGAKKIDIRVRRGRRRSAAQNITDTDNPLLGPVFPRYMGGIANPYGSSHDDHILYAPGGAPVAAMSGTEGIVNAPQMGVIDNALSFTRQMTGMPWGSLNDLWGSGMRHYQTGGGLQPPIRSLSNRLDRMFGLTTTSTVRPGGTSYHRLGLAADISGTPQAMARASRYIRSSGIWRSLLEGIHNPGLSVKNGQMVPASFWGAGTWSDHIDHIHLALQKAVSGIAARVRTPQISGLGSDALSRIVRGSARTMTRAANRYLQRQMNALGGGDPRAMGADANVISAFRRAIRSAGANSKERLALWEAGIVESGLKNLHYGDADSLGSLQERASIYGRAHALNPFASATRFLRDARGMRPWRGTAGMLAAAVQRPAAQFRGRYDQVRGQAQRYMQRGGPLTGRATPVRPAIPFLRSPFAPLLNTINDLFQSVTETLERVARGPLRRSKNLALRIQRAFDRITREGGLLDQMRASVEQIATRVALRLQQRQFRVGAQGPRRVALTDAQIARGELEGLQLTRSGLRAERGGIREGITAAQRALTIARRRKDTRAIAAAEAALTNLQTRLDENTTAMAQNAQDQVETQERFQQALLDATNAAAERQNSAIDRWSRTAKALGQNLDPNAVLGAQVANMRQQIGGLQGVLAQATRTGNVQLANQVAEQIAELNTQIAEAAAQQFQNAIDAVNNEAQRQGTRLDRQARLAQLGGRTNFAAMQNILQTRQGVFNTQRAGLLGLLAQAQSTGNVEQVDNLVDQIDELNVQMAENTQAIQDNTDAAFDFTTQMITARADFTTSVFSGAQGFFQALAENSGINTLPQQLSALQGIASSLATQQSGLLGQLASMFSWTPEDLQAVLSMTGADLVNYLTYLATDPDVQNILAGYSPAQQEAFRNLITSLIGNATAIEQNTDALHDLNGNMAQSFSTSFWTNLRQAIFTGAGGLLPQYQAVVPTAQIGARVMRSGMLLVHAGENVRPARVSHVDGSGGGDVYNLNLTTPTEVLDPVDVGRQLAFYRKVNGRR